ncbi:hypothetical protein BGZ61DRAFT_438209 [Ilyonectria robusta]|uniref:uncharacterized protein n=1 Tax=Ilyonectria robusta TaxID=1079257 RepID=UPI001E8E48D3|nr:uncharacterized protein BGZ61DRAFT_438209 [Ilyonectria robusta]KAH8737375.1 hypothetical protein BGZ61DRAFT_438209 [Ilyonectria robusta]
MGSISAPPIYPPSKYDSSRTSPAGLHHLGRRCSTTDGLRQETTARMAQPRSVGDDRRRRGLSDTECSGDFCCSSVCPRRRPNFERRQVERRSVKRQTGWRSSPRNSKPQCGPLTKPHVRSRSRPGPLSAFPTQPPTLAGPHGVSAVKPSR